MRKNLHNLSIEILGEGDPVILLHGLSQQADYWLPVIKHIRKYRSVITVDLPGHGDSQNYTTLSDYSISSVSTRITTIIEDLDIPSVSIIGHSWGASIALNVAASHPALISSLVLIDGGHFVPSDLVIAGAITQPELISQLTPPRGPFTSKQLIENYSIDNDHVINNSALEAVARSYRRSGNSFESQLGFDRHMKILRDFLAYENSDDISNVRVPVTSITCFPSSTHDPSHSPMADLWTAAKISAHRKMSTNPFIHRENWYGAVHDVPLQWPETVAQTILSASRPVIGGNHDRV